MQLLNDYLQKQQELFDYFGYVENWKAIPVDNATMYYWQLNGEEHGGEVLFADSKEELFSGEGNYYSNDTDQEQYLICQE
jgi:hypothetical protein